MLSWPSWAPFSLLSGTLIWPCAGPTPRSDDDDDDGRARRSRNKCGTLNWDRHSAHRAPIDFEVHCS
uniref:Putative secreted protein n=1 Tax=Anopheles marajoara TaxID=58244 RepID=A0A2M4CFQ4_9DIPT